MNQKILIHYDFKDGTELPYLQAKQCKEDFTTNCLEFFSTENINAVLVRSDGKTISVRDLLEGNGEHTRKQIRKAHNIHKMLIGDAFAWG